jgi:hypothetical protein
MLAFLTLGYLVMCPLNAQVQQTVPESSLKNTTMAQLELINKLLVQIAQTRTIQNLLDANREMKQLPSPTVNDSSLPERTKTWFKIISLMDANKDLHLTKDDQAYSNIQVPGEEGWIYPSGVVGLAIL